MWKSIPGWPYEVSDKGEVRNGRGVLLNGSIDPDGYPKVCLSGPQGAQKSFKVHHLVLEAFIGPRPDGYDGCHNDGNPGNNHLPNLRWDTKGSNAQDRLYHGRDYQSQKTHCPRGHELLPWNNVASFALRGHRACLACSRARAYFNKRKRRHGESHTEDEMQALSDIKYLALTRGQDSR